MKVVLLARVSLIEGANVFACQSSRRRSEIPLLYIVLASDRERARVTVRALDGSHKRTMRFSPFGLNPVTDDRASRWCSSRSRLHSSMAAQSVGAHTRTAHCANPQLIGCLAACCTVRAAARVGTRNPGESGRGSFVLQQAKLSELVSVPASSSAAAEIAEADQQLDDVSVGVEHLLAGARAIGSTLDSHIEECTLREVPHGVTPSSAH